MRPSRKHVPETVAVDKAEPTLTFLGHVWALAHALDVASRRMDRELGVTGPQRFVIRMVGMHPQISAGDLARQLRLNPSTLSLLIAKLEKRGLLTRAGDRLDGRRSLFALTSKGRALDRTRTGTIEARVGATLARTPRAQVEAAAAVMALLSSDLLADKRPAR